MSTELVQLVVSVGVTHFSLPFTVGSDAAKADTPKGADQGWSLTFDAPESEEPQDALVLGEQVRPYGAPAVERDVTDLDLGHGVLGQLQCRRISNAQLLAKGLGGDKVFDVDAHDVLSPYVEASL
jgi:hypothetical protein